MNASNAIMRLSKACHIYMTGEWMLPCCGASITMQTLTHELIETENRLFMKRFAYMDEYG